MSLPRNGYTLLEVVIALAVWAVLALSASQLLVYVSRASTRMLASQDSFENVRVALDTLITNIQMADEIVIEHDLQQRFRRLTLTERNPEGNPQKYVFYFNPSAQPGEAKYHRLEFGENNELASHIAYVTLILTDDCVLSVTVGSDGSLCPAFSISASADVRYKKVTVKLYG